MRTRMIIFGIAALIACESHAADAVSEQKSWTQTHAVSAATPRLLIRNIWGNVRVRSGASQEIVVSVDERRSAPTQVLFEQSKRSFFLDVRTDANGVALTVEHPEEYRSKPDRCLGCRLDYQFEVLVPPGTHVDVATVTDGRVDVAVKNGTVDAMNVNGPVAVAGLDDCANIKSVNGALSVSFAGAPTSECSIETVNGEIRIGLPATASLNAVLNVTHGEIESEFDVEPFALPVQVEKTVHEDRHKDGWGYRIERGAGIRIGADGPTFNIASLNGDVRIVKNK
jgi:hypothetical protein